MMLKHPPVICGLGPAGLFCALVLARKGYRPVILERGPALEDRVQAIDRFNATGELDPNANIQFGCNIQPFFIGGSDKYGLGKHDPLWSYNHSEMYKYDIKRLPEIPVADYKDLSEPIAAKHLTQKMEEVIKSAGDAYYANYTGPSRNNY